MGPVDREVEVAVVGGGPGGCVAALLLASRGQRVVVLERNAPGVAAGAGILLQPNGLAVLDAIGLGDPLRARGAEQRSVALYDDRGHVLIDTPVPDFGRGLDHALVVRRSSRTTRRGARRSRRCNATPNGSRDWVTCAVRSRAGFATGSSPRSAVPPSSSDRLVRPNRSTPHGSTTSSAGS